MTSKTWDKTVREENKEANQLTKPNDITINYDYSSLMPALSKLQYESMKNSIKEDGLHLPIIINSKGEILDGHHRYQICKELDIPIIYEIKYFNDSFEEKKFVIDINLKRRQLNDFEKAELGYTLEDIYKELGKLSQIEAGRLFGRGKNKFKERSVPKETNLFDKVKIGRTDENVAKQVGVSRTTYQRAKSIIEFGSEEEQEKVRLGKTTISKQYEKIQRDRKRLELMSQIAIESKNDTNNFENKNYKLIYGDFIEKQKQISDNSIDLIFTDPPYGKESLALYKELAKLAVRVLKPGGSIVTYVGHIILNEVIIIFHDFSLNGDNSINLKYWWEFAVKHSGHHQKVYPRHVFPGWKPLLWYIKGERANDLVVSNTIGDYIESSSPSKLLHEWEQSTAEAEHIIKNLTIQNQTVLDPMIGSGTTGIAARILKRRFIGIEKDHETFLKAKARFANIDESDYFLGSSYSNKEIVNFKEDIGKI